MKTLPSLLVFLFFLGTSTTLHGQCPTFISANSQQKLDDFIAEYPNCTEIANYISISGDVTDLSPLSNITSVGNYLSIRAENLSSLSGLDALTHVAKDFRIENAHALSDLQGLSNLTTVGEDFDIQSNDNLLVIGGLESLTSIGGEINIFNNQNLQLIEGLANLESLGQDLRISTNEALTSISTLPNLTAIPGECVISGNPLVQEIRFDHLVTIGERLSVSGAGLLSFAQLEEADQIYFQGNSQVHTINLPALTRVNDNFIIGLPNSLNTLICGEELEFIGGSFHINSLLTAVPAFPVLETIGEWLVVNSQNTLESFNSMEALTTVESIYFVQHDILREINAFNSLVSVSGEVEIRENDSLAILNAFTSLETVAEDFYIGSNRKLNDCSSLCNFIENGTAGDFVIFGNGNSGGPCRTESRLRDACDSPFEGVRFADANPGLLSAFYPNTENVRHLEPGQLVDLDLNRTAVAADGVSELLVITEFNEPGTVQMTSLDSLLEQPWGDATVEVDGAHYNLAIFKAPENFTGNSERSVKSSGAHSVESTSISISISYDGSEPLNASTQIELMRPPVVLVHGTYANPARAWMTASQGGQSMVEVLTNAGLKVFAVDYESSNGSSSSGPSSFEDNKMVLWENQDGIRDALEHYRNEMQTAVTQVDVVGHSLGGILPRVYASGHFNPNYIRSENFFAGDINRLITLASTHYGSHLGELQVFLEDASIFDIGPLEWIVAQGQAFITSWFAGTAASPAIRDQLPPPANDALANIGATEIPAHAITLSVDRGMLKDEVHDPQQEYFDLYWYISLLLYHNDDLRDLYLDYKMTLVEMGLRAETTLEGGDPQELFPGYTDLMFFRDMIKDGLRYSGQLFSILDGTFELPSDIEILHWVMSEVGMGDIADPLLQIYQFGSDPTGVVAKYFRDALMPNAEDALESYLTVYDENMEALRALIFNNDDNDGVVRVESQSGELEKQCPECVTHYDNVLHGFAPRYSEVQQGLVSLLKGGMEQFHEDGFAAVENAQKLYYPEEVSALFKIPVTGPAAICQSGMAPAHARAFARVADEQNAIIIARPVNPDGLPLIQKGAATKVMDVKPKSSNWGPQKGYLPSRQRYSKLWKVFEGAKRDEMISKYDMKVTENLSEGITVERHLQVEACNGTYLVYVDENKNTGMSDLSAEDEVVLVPSQDPNMVCTWGDNFSPDMIIRDCVDRTSEHFLSEFKVMATPDVLEDDNETPRFLTADYDLLMIGFQEGPGQGDPSPPEVEFLPGVGQITPAQQSLVNELNGEVARTGYDGGNVTHHGPENQFSGSPYVDYPLTVFAPDNIPNGFFSGSTDGKILSIDMGPPGFRDIHLKRFINRMREEGYDLYHNPAAPGWHWEWDSTIPGYKLEDSDMIVDYVDQLPNKHCDKSGDEEKSTCIKSSPAAISPPASPGSWLFRTPHTGLDLSLVNSLATSYIELVINSEKYGEISLFIQDAMGNVRAGRKVNLVPGTTRFSWAVDQLETGIYSVIAPPNTVVRFVRM